MQKRPWLQKVAVFCAFSLLFPALALACNPAKFIVAVDVGHTVHSPGAVSARGIPELQFNRKLANEVLQALRIAGFTESVLINADGRIASLSERVRQANQAQASLFLSIHHDSVQPHYLGRWRVGGVTRRYSDRFHGYSLFISGDSQHFEASRRFAILTGQSLIARGLSPTLHHAEPIPGENRPLLDLTLGVYRYDDLYVLRHASMPALLLEAGVIVNREEEIRLQRPAYWQRIAASVVTAVTDFCNEADPMPVD